MIVVDRSVGRGRGVFAAQPIPAGTLIEEGPVIVLPAHEIEYLEHTALGDYYFLWGADERSGAILLGVCSLCNHSYEPNAVFETRLDTGTIRFVALRDIPAGEEITTNYHGDPASREPVWFDVRE
jgi:SET domain-containing protein